ncbi:MAG: DUF3224 domain-containing protein [Deinococcales bacterium]
MKITGKFKVRLEPLPPPPLFSHEHLNIMSIDKNFEGDLEGHSQGQMLSALTSTKGSAGYVAIERFTGTLNGKKGSFILQHHALMTRGQPQQTITVIPDSATEELEGLSGSMLIRIEANQHFYDFDYDLP